MRIVTGSMDWNNRVRLKLRGDGESKVIHNPGKTDEVKVLGSEV